MGDKKLCKIVEKRELEEKKELEKYIGLVKNGKYLCKRCGRVATDKDSICKPIKMEE